MTTSNDGDDNNHSDDDDFFSSLENAYDEYRKNEEKNQRIENFLSSLENHGVVSPAVAQEAAPKPQFGDISIGDSPEQTKEFLINLAILSYFYDGIQNKNGPAN